MEKRTGVYICHCGLNIASTVDTRGVVSFSESHHEGVIVREYMFMCFDPGQELIVNNIKKHNLDRFVVGHAPLFAQANLPPDIGQSGGL